VGAWGCGRCTRCRARPETRREDPTSACRWYRGRHPAGVLLRTALRVQRPDDVLGDPTELIEVPAPAARGRLRADHTTAPLQEAAAGYGWLAAVDITGRAAVVPIDSYTPHP
jgi:hypothetical protein